MRETTSTMRLWTQVIRSHNGDGLTGHADEAVVMGPMQFIAASNDHDGAVPHAAMAAAAQRAMFNRICVHIEANLVSDTLDLTTLQSQFGVSRSMLCRLFEEAGGVANHIRTRRLEKAVQRLADDAHCSITDLLYEVGFTSPRQFQRAFRSHFGMSPMQWREHCHGMDMTRTDAMGADCQG